MSDDQLDNEFRNRVKEVFDDYEDDTGAEGWMLLREKFPEKKSDRVEAWLWRYVSIAALALAILSIALWFNFQRTNNLKLAAKNGGPKKDTVNISTQPIVKNKTQIVGHGANAAHQNTARLVNPVVADVIKPAASVISAQQPNIVINKVNNTPINPAAYSPKGAIAAVNKPATNNNGKPAYPAVNTTNGPVTAVQPTNNTGPVIPANNNTGSTVASVKPATTVSPFSPLGNDSAKNKNIAAVPSADAVKKTPSVIIKKKPEKSLQSLFDNDKYTSAQNHTTDVKVKNRRIVFGVYAATYVNYAKGSNNQFNTGAGVSSDIRLTNNLSIATGVAIAQNSFAYNGLSTNPSISYNAAVSHNFAAVATATATTFDRLAPTSRNLNASLIGMDIPVDLKYMFNPQKSSAYIAAGLSSGTFINETYNYTYSYNAGNNVPAPQAEDETTRKTFDNFYFAKMLNVSFGVGYPLGRGNQLIIEPFVKYPLNGLGDQHILFGSGGINLKLNFDPPKRR